MHFSAPLWVKQHSRPLASDHNSHVCLPSSFLLWDLPEHDADPGSPAELCRHGAGIAVPHGHGAYPYPQGLPGRGLWSPGADPCTLRCCLMPGTMLAWGGRSCCSTLCCKGTFLKKHDLACRALRAEDCIILCLVSFAKVLCVQLSEGRCLFAQQLR